MASILFCSEAYAGFGHLKPYREALKRLQERGHQIQIAARDLTRAAMAFENLPFRYWQAPIPQNLPESLFVPTINFTQFLYNCGMSDPTDAAVRIAIWRNLFVATRPALVLVDHCPAALLALRGTEIPVLLIGTGFLIPPDSTPFPPFEPFAHLSSPATLLNQEQHLLLAINAAASRHGIAPLSTLAQLYNEVSGQLLRTIPEFDPFPDRAAPQYLGLLSEAPGNPVEWPSGEGDCVFAYLKPFAAIEGVFQELQQRGCRAIIASDGLSVELREKHASPRLQFVAPNVDLPQMGREARFGITNGNPTTSGRLLLQGCPLICIPTLPEQEISTKIFQKLKVAAALNPVSTERTSAVFSEILNNPLYRESATALAAKYSARPDESTERLLTIIERLLTRSAVALAGAVQ